MKKLFLLLISITFTLLSFAQFETQKQVFESPKLKESIAKHKKVAILPFKTSITYKRVPKDYDAEANKNEEKQLVTGMQSGMHIFLLRKSDNYTVQFQETEKTNALLKKAGIYDKLDEVLMDSVCKILGVDAVIKCNYAYEKVGSGAVLGAVLFGSKTGSGALTMQIYNGEDGELLWRFYKEMNEQLLSNTNEVMERLMRKVSRNFPYEK